MATASVNNATGTFMFHPRTAVFEQPITYHLPPSNTNSSATVTKPDVVDFSQYYITLESRTTILKSAKGPISVAECDSQGRFIQIENTSRSKSISLAHWTLRQENNHGEIINYKFPENTLLKPNHALKVFAQSNESDRRTGDLVASTLSTWYTDANVVTTLINAEGKDRASLTKKTLFS